MSMNAGANESGDPVKVAVASFQRAFGAAGRWAGAAPGRVNLIGEHTDYNQGFVLPIAIDRVCACVGGPTTNAASGGTVGRIGTFSVGTNTREDAGKTESGDGAGLRVVEVDWGEVTNDAAGVVARLATEDAWAKYVIGVVSLFRRDYAPTLPAMDIAIASNVPLGSGLSSSASLEVSVCTMLEEATGVALAKIGKARLCQRAEHEFAGVPCGLMDQYASVFGQRGRAMMIDCHAATHQTLILPPTDDNGAVVVVINSNVRHELAEGEYAKRRRLCEDAAAALGARSLREVDLFDESRQRMLADFPRDMYDATLHVFSENQRVEKVAQECRRVAEDRTTWKRALPEIGQQMVQSHASLRDRYRVSCAELDAIVEIAMGVRGVYGARMTGGGFGGCAIALVRPSKVEDLVGALAREYPARAGRECTTFVVNAGDGARGIRISG